MEGRDRDQLLPPLGTVRRIIFDAFLAIELMLKMVLIRSETLGEGIYYLNNKISKLLVSADKNELINELAVVAL